MYSIGQSREIWRIERKVDITLNLFRSMFTGNSFDHLQNASEFERILMWTTCDFSLNNFMVVVKITRNVLVWGKVEWRMLFIFYEFLSSVSSVFDNEGIQLLVWQGASMSLRVQIGEKLERVFPKCGNSEIYMLLHKTSHGAEKKFYKLSIITNCFQPC